MKRYIRLSIAYDGTNYHGWQIQPSGITVQGAVEGLLQKITGQAVRLIGAGRTDAGVHAIEQVAVFATGSRLSPDTFACALNSTLPPDISILHASEVSENFNPRYDAIKKRYIYLVSTPVQAFVQRPSPFAQRYVWQVNYPLDIGHMSMALNQIGGMHDFKAFSATGTDVKTTERVMHEASIERLGGIGFMDFRLDGDFLKFRFEANGFLRHMVRNLVGTIVDIGRGRLVAEDMSRILEGRDRKLAGRCAPARGLFLEKVFY